MTSLEIDLAIGDPQVQHIRLAEQAVGYFVQVGELVASAIHRKEVGVAFHEEQFLRDRVFGNPRSNARALWVEKPIPTVGIIFIPRVKAGRFNLGV